MQICYRNPQGCIRVRKDIQKLFKQQDTPLCTDEELMNDEGDVFVITPQISELERVEIIFDSRQTYPNDMGNTWNNQKSPVTPMVICLPGPVPYQSEKAIPYKYNATMIDNGKEVPLPSVVNITDISRVTRSGRVFNKNMEKVPLERESRAEILEAPVGRPSDSNHGKDNDEILKIIQKSEYNIVD